MKFPYGHLSFLHIAAWLCFLSLPLLFISAEGSYGISELYRLPLYWLYFSIYPAFFYLHTYLFFPRLYLAGKYGIYAISLLLMLTAVFLLRPFDRTLSGRMQRPAGQVQLLPDHRPPGNEPPPPEPGQDWPPPRNNPGDPRPAAPPSLPPAAPAGGGAKSGPVLDIVSILFFVLTIGISVTVQATRRWRIATRMAAQAETDKVNAELSFLKAQINPHFLFNTLNNIYSLAVSKDDNTADSIMKLSNIMRYITEEASGNFVPLQSEADCIADYIDLQLLRLSKKSEINYTVAGPLETKNIAPLILMTYVENVFKYGISSHEPSPVNIRLTAGTEGITFFCSNRIYPASNITERTGIGIANNQKRLDFLYPGRHLLRIGNENGLFTVTLTLQV